MIKSEILHQIVSSKAAPKMYQRVKGGEFVVIFFTSNDYMVIATNKSEWDVGTTGISHTGCLNTTCWQPFYGKITMEST